MHQHVYLCSLQDPYRINTCHNNTCLIKSFAVMTTSSSSITQSYHYTGGRGGALQHLFVSPHKGALPICTTTPGEGGGGHYSTYLYHLIKEHYLFVPLHWGKGGGALQHLFVSPHKGALPICTTTLGEGGGHYSTYLYYLIKEHYLFVPLHWGKGGALQHLFVSPHKGALPICTTTLGEGGGHYSTYLYHLIKEHYLFVPLHWGKGGGITAPICITS